MVTAFIKYGDGRIDRDPSPKSIAAALRDPNAIFWVDLSNPTDEEYAYLDDVFGFHPLAIEDSISYSQRPKIESYNHVGDACDTGYFYMVIHAPDLTAFRENLRTKELDMFVSERYLLTIHEEPIRSITELLTKGEADARVVLDMGIDMLLHNLLDHLVDHYTPILDYLQESIDDIEERAMNAHGSDILVEISQKKRELLNLRRVIGPQREVIAMLTRGEVPFIRESTRIYLRDVLDHLVRAVEMTDLYRELIASARDIHLSTVSLNLNKIMRTLTVLSVIALPLTVITSFFGMNFENLPGIHSIRAFWFTMALMGAAVATLLFAFRRMRWL